MPEDRRLAAIMFTDIVGYTALMGRDEDKAFQILRKNRDIQRPIIKKYRGEWLKEMGDGILASFHTSSDAVRCAGEIQNEAKKAGIPLRIGIHEGEVVFEGTDVWGDGVNIASRLQETSDKGCISISEAVYNNIKNKSDIKSDYEGERVLKGVAGPIKVYKVICEAEAEETENSVTSEKPPDKKSIIVLPFENMSPDPDQEYFSDGLTEEIITDLSHIHDLLVISRNSAMTFKRTKKKTKEIASEVNVRYVLEGSVRKAGNNLRITAQLIDGVTDSHLWAEKYSGTLDDVFDIQEKVSQSIVDALRIELGSKDHDRINTSKFENVQAHECYLKARHDIYLLREESFDEALRFIDRGLQITGDNELLYALKSTVYVQYINLLSKPPETFEDLLSIAQENASKSLEINSNSAQAHFAQGVTFHQHGNPRGAIIHFGRATSINPNYSDALFVLGYHYVATGFNNDEGRRLLEKAAKIDPLTVMTTSSVGWFHFFNGNYDMVVKEFDIWQKSLEEVKSPILLTCAWVHALNHNLDEAIRLIDDIIFNKPNHVMSALGSFMKNACLGKKQKALNAVNETLDKAAWWDDAYSLMMTECYALLGEKDIAFRWLEHSIDYGYSNVEFLVEHDPFLENLRSDKRFEDCIEKAKRFVESLRTDLVT